MKKLPLLLLCSLLGFFAHQPLDASEGLETRILAEAKGINLANALEAPEEGDWGVVLQEEYFDFLKRAGFTLVRIPAAFAAHADPAAPFVMKDVFLARLDEVLRWTAERRLTAILAFHSYNELYQNPAANMERFLAIWEQVAEKFASRYPDCLFGILNEPHGNMTAELWNELLGKAVKRIRRIDSSRRLIVGGISYNDALSLDDLVLPAGDKNLVAAFHYYRPYEFTHQGAAWAEGMDKWLGQEWSGDAEEMAALKNDFAIAADWSKKTGVQVFLEEFGCIAKAPPDSRVRWIKAVRKEAESHGFGWAYWDFCAGFGIFNVEKEKFEPGMLEALMTAD